MHDSAMTQPEGLPFEDNYWSYPDEVFGTTWDVWDVQTPASLARFDDLSAASAEALDAQPLAELDDLERLAVALGWRALGRADRSMQTLRHILDGPQDHACLRYDEIYERLTHDALLADDRVHARELIEHLRTRHPAHALLGRLDGLWQALHGAREGARDAYAGFVEGGDEDEAERAERCADVADELGRFGLIDEAEWWLAQALERAQRAGHRALLVDLTLLGQRLTQARTSAES